MLIWAFCLHMSLVNLLISLGQYLLIPSYLFWWVLTKKLCKYVGTLRVHGHWSLFRAPQQGVKPDYRFPLVVQAFYLWKIMPHLLFQGVGFWRLHICVSGFVFFINPFWKSMFHRLKKAHTSFSHPFMRLEMTFLPQLKKCTLLLKVWQLLAPQVCRHL